MKEFIVAGGCFWCIAAPFYELDGVLRVVSGYCGGKEVNPTYKEVKGQYTHHRESICIRYDETKINYKKLLRVYFDNIDPFDAGGQYIDRGASYSCAVFTDDPTERLYAEAILQAYENQYGRKTHVELLPLMPFYEAEEEHQDFALKHPDLLEKELKESGRKK